MRAVKSRFFYFCRDLFGFTSTVPRVRDISKKNITLGYIVIVSVLSLPLTCNAKYQETGKTVLGNGQVPFSSLTPEMVSNFRI